MKPLPVTKDGPPRQLGRFELVAELASGGMATVYLGRLGGAGGFQRFVAIKRLHSHLANDAEFVDMFLDEARLAARLHHPNVVPILEIGTSERGYYLVMEYVEGETLARLLNLSHQAGSPVPINVTVRVFLDVLAGLHAAHELVGDDGRGLDIVHRDVSPQNVLVGVEGSAKITDFGVAHAADRLAHTRTGQLKGKFSYMAPEQALGYSVDRRADVFAVGTCLWEALACKRLFKGDTEADTLEKVLRGHIPRLRSLVPSIPPAIEEVVAKALDRDRDRRLRSAAHFAEALEQAANQSGVLGTQRDVSTHVQRVLGPLLVQQREAVRQWIAGMDLNRPQSPSDLAETRGPGPAAMAETRGPATRVERARPLPAAGVSAVPAPPRPAASVSPAPPSLAPASAASGQNSSLLAMVEDRPARSIEDTSGESSVVAIGAVERSTVSHVTRSRSSMAPTFAVAGLLLVAGAIAGVMRLNSDGEANASQAKGATSAAPSATNAKLAPPPVPTTPIGTPLVAASPQFGASTQPVGGPPGTAAGLPGTAGVPGAVPGAGIPSAPGMPGAVPGAGVPGAMVTQTTPAAVPGVPGAFGSPTAPAPGLGPPPVPTTPIGSFIPAAPSTSTAPTIGINELPAAPRAAAPRPAPRPRSEPRVADEPRPRRPEPRSEPRSERGSSSNDDDIGRNPYR